MALKHLWKKIIAIGIATQMPRKEQKRVLMLNTYALILSMVYVSYVMVSLLVGIWEVVLMSILGLTIFMSPLAFNYLKNYQASRWVFSLGTQLYFASYTIYFGLNFGLHYALLVSSILPVFFFRTKAISYGLASLNLAIFLGVAAYCYFLGAVNPYNDSLLYFVNLLFVFYYFLIFVYLFLADYDSFELELISYNSELEAKNRNLREAKSELQGAYKDLVSAESELRDSNTELRSAKQQLELLVDREREKQLALEKSEQELKQLNTELASSEAEMRQYLEEILHINANLEHTKDHLEQFFATKNNDKKRLKWVNEQLKKTQNQLVQAEKMSSLGQLTAGIAHELNNPITFVSAGVEVMQETFQEMNVLLQKYEQLEQMDSVAEKEAQIQDIIKLKEVLQYDALLEELQTTLNDILVGAKRTADIVKGLGSFSRTDERESRFANLHENIDAALLILNNKLRNRIDVVKNYDKSMEEIECYPGQLNQVFMNLLSNAIQAIGDQGQIKISSYNFNDEVKVIITDNGCGISEEVLNKIFDPFFTTKEVGEGTGLGLSISYGIIERHAGKILAESTVNEGTTFTIHLPKRLPHAD